MRIVKQIEVVDATGGQDFNKTMVRPDAVGYWDATYPVPATLVRGKTKVTVRFQATPPGRIAPVFGVRMVRATAR